MNHSYNCEQSSPFPGYQSEYKLELFMHSTIKINFKVDYSFFKNR